MHITSSWWQTFLSLVTTEKAVRTGPHGSLEVIIPFFSHEDSLRPRDEFPHSEKSSCFRFVLVTQVGPKNRTKSCHHHQSRDDVLCGAPVQLTPASCLRARGRCGPCHTMTSQLCCVRLARKHGGNEMGCCISSWHAPWATFYSLLLLTSCPSLALQVLSPCRFERHAARGTPLRLTGCLRGDSRTGAEWNILSKTRC